MLYVRAIVFDQHVGAFDQAFEDSERLGVLEVQGEAPLVAMEVLKIGTGARTDLGGVVVGGFDFQDVGTPIGELAHGRRS